MADIRSAQLVITMMPARFQHEGVAAVLDRLQAAGAAAQQPDRFEYQDDDDVDTGL